MLTMTRSLTFPFRRRRLCSTGSSSHPRRSPTISHSPPGAPSSKHHFPVRIISPPAGATPIPIAFCALGSVLAFIRTFIVMLFAPFAPRRRAGGDATARRSMAIQRLLEGDVDEQVSERGFELLPTARGDTLFTQWWRPARSSIRGLVILLHGLNEHSSRYDDFARQLSAEGLKVHAMDWIGHGGSDGLHGYVPNLDFAVADMKVFLKKVLAESPGLPCFCFGHSTGGSIVLKAVMDPNVASDVQGIMLTSPAVRIQPSHPLVVMFAPILSLLLPRYEINHNADGPPISRDPKAVIAKYSDPLVYTGFIRIRTGSEILRITSYIQQNLHRLTVPFLVLHGTADTVTDPKASRKLHNESFSTDKSLKLYDGFLHDLLFEPERDVVSKDIIDWLKCRIQ